MRRVSTGNSLNRVGVLWSVDLPPPPNKRQLRLHTTLSSVVTPLPFSEHARNLGVPHPVPDRERGIVDLHSFKQDLLVPSEVDINLIFGGTCSLTVAPRLGIGQAPKRVGAELRDLAPRPARPRRRIGGAPPPSAAEKGKKLKKPRTPTGWP